MPVTASKEDYLERIQELIESKGYARVSDVAEALGLTRSTVTTMVQQLSRDGYLNYERYRGFTMTKRGEQVAASIQERHQVLTELFQLLGVDAKNLERDVEGIEHHLSEVSFQKLQKLILHLQKFPMKK